MHYFTVNFMATQDLQMNCPMAILFLTNGTGRYVELHRLATKCMLLCTLERKYRNSEADE